jgi:transcriptional regulator with XRE-family HTH domain
MGMDKEILITNIYALAKKKNIKIGSLEEQSGVSKGYLSRVSKGVVKALPPVDVLKTMAGILDVSVDYLIEYDSSEYTESEKYIIKFLDKLIKLTNESNLDWILETATVLNEDSDRNVDNPMVSVIDGYSAEFDKLYKTHQYSSSFNGETYTRIQGNCYHVRLPQSLANVYLMSVVYGSQERFGSEHPALEMYLYEKGAITPLCSSFFTRDSIAQQMHNLYSSIENRISRIGLDSHTKGILDNFLK